MGSWGTSSIFAETYSKNRFFGPAGVTFGPEAAKTAESWVKFLRTILMIMQSLVRRQRISRSQEGVYRGGSASMSVRNTHNEINCLASPEPWTSIACKTLE